MTDHKKKGDFHKTDDHAEREGGNKKQDNSLKNDGKGTDGQNAGHGGNK